MRNTLPSLWAFLNLAKENSSHPSNGYVREVGWKSLYIRYTSHYLCGHMVPTIDLANIEARKKGAGAFRSLVLRLQKGYPDRTIYVENVLTERFANGLRRMGFTQEGRAGSRMPACFYLAAGKPLKIVESDPAPISEDRPSVPDGQIAVPQLEWTDCLS